MLQSTLACCLDYFVGSNRLREGTSLSVSLLFKKQTQKPYILEYLQVSMLYSFFLSFRRVETHSIASYKAAKA